MKTVYQMREEQIEEMVGIMCDDFGVSFFAERLYDAGYRKQSDTVREFVERLKSEYLSKEGDFVYWVIDVDDIAKVAKEYGAEVEE